MTIPPDAEASARFKAARCDHGLNRHGEAVEGFRAYVGRDREAWLDDTARSRTASRALACWAYRGLVQTQGRGRNWTAKKLFARATLDRGAHVARRARHGANSLLRRLCWPRTRPSRPRNRRGARRALLRGATGS